MGIAAVLIYQSFPTLPNTAVVRLSQPDQKFRGVWKGKDLISVLWGVNYSCLGVGTFGPDVGWQAITLTVGRLKGHSLAPIPHLPHVIML